MSRTMGKPFVVSKCIMLAVCVVCAASVFMMAGCQTQGATNGSQNAQSSASSGKTAGAAKGEPAPDAPLTMLDGSARSISDFQGSVTIVSFWATWCPYCIKEMPDLQRNYPDVNVVMVNCGEDQALVADFVQQHDYDFTWALDPNFEAQTAYPTSGIPYTVVIDPEGNVSEIFAGSGRDMYSRFESAVQQAIG